MQLLLLDLQLLDGLPLQPKVLDVDVKLLHLELIGPAVLPGRVPLPVAAGPLGLPSQG